MNNDLNIYLDQYSETIAGVVRQLGAITYEQIKRTLQYAQQGDFDYDAFTRNVIYTLRHARLMFQEGDSDVYKVNPVATYTQSRLDAYWVMLNIGLDFDMLGSLYTGDYPVELGYLRGDTNYEIAYIPSGSYAPILNLCNRYATHLSDEAMEMDIQKYILIFEDPKMVTEIDKYIKDIPFHYICVSVDHSEEIPSVKII